MRNIKKQFVITGHIINHIEQKSNKEINCMVYDKEDIVVRSEHALLVLNA